MRRQFHFQFIISEFIFFFFLPAFSHNALCQLSSNTLSEKSLKASKLEVIELYEKTKPKLFEQLIFTTKTNGRLFKYIYVNEPLWIAKEDGVRASKAAGALIKDKYSRYSKRAVAYNWLVKLADELFRLIWGQFQCLCVASLSQPGDLCGQPSITVRKVQGWYVPHGQGQTTYVCLAHIYFWLGTRRRKVMVSRAKHIK